MAGTQIVGGAATVISVVLTQRTASTLRLRSGLYGWMGPDWSEDLMLLRASGEVVLGSIAHERDGYLVVSDAEVERIRNQ